MFLIINSKNKKIGDIAATYLPINKTCPKTCLFKNKGCYGQLSYVGIFNLKLENKNKHLSAYDIIRKEAREIAAFGPKAKGKTLRLHISGDSRTAKSTNLLAKASEQWDGKVYTYTHSWRTVKRKVWGKISVLASIDSIKDTSSARKQGYAPAIVLSDFPSHKAFTINQCKTKWIPCPSQTRDITCAQCKLCFNANRLFKDKLGIAFKAHSVRKNILVKHLPIVLK
jgi:hypothetical protein